MTKIDMAKLELKSTMVLMRQIHGGLPPEQLETHMKKIWESTARRIERDHGIPEGSLGHEEEA